ncbi:MAG: hypothetical protein V2A67_06590 [Bacteroidota bacterium]
MATVMLLAVIIRIRLNFGQELLPGINGGYYPLLSRNLLEYGSIRYPDAPLVHWLTAGLSWMIGVVSGLSKDHAAILSVRLLDSLIPPLACIPVFLYAYRFVPGESRKVAISVIMSSFSIMYLSPLVILSSDMLKNSVGLVFLTSFLFYALRAINSSDKRDYLIAFLFLILTGLTHIGSFAVAVAFVLIAGLVILLRSLKSVDINRIILILISLSVIILISFALLRNDPGRLSRVQSIWLNPLRLFESPYLFLLLNGQNPYSGFLWHNFLLVNLLSIAGVLIVLFNLRKLSFRERACALSLSLLSLFLSSPLIGIEWALRYQLMAYLPVIFLYIYIFRFIKNKFVQYGLITFFGLLTLISGIGGFTAIREPAITTESYQDLKRIRDSVEIRGDDLVIARHGLEWWTGWVLRCRTGKEYCLRQSDWERYPDIYLLRQVKGNNYTDLMGSNQFSEFMIPESSVQVYSSDLFNLYRLNRPAPDEFYPGELPLVQGRVDAITGNTLFVLADGYRQKVIYNSKTDFPVIHADSIKPGMRIDIWGRRTPFSLKIRAEQILIIN